MFQNKKAIEDIAYANGGSDFISVGYWSSTEYVNKNHAWHQSFDSGNQDFYTNSLFNKSRTGRVRAIRAF